MTKRKSVTVSLEHVSTGYKSKKGNKVVATDLNIALYSGSLTCVLGTNGAGKSTLLKSMASFNSPLSGTISVLGKPLSNYSDAELSTIIGVVLTEKVDIRDMVVKELVSMGRSPYSGFWGRLTNSDKKIVDKAIKVVGIENLANRTIHTLSDGERQKVMIAKVLAQETPIIFLDEPTAFLDFPSKVDMMRMLHRLTRDLGKTILMSTHDLELALQISDTIWLLDKNSGIVSGTPEDLALSGALSSFFASKGIVFDTDSGLFRIENNFQHEIKMDGCGQKFAMVRKALQRDGIKAGRHVDTAFYIETGNLDFDGFVLHEANGDCRKVDTIAKVIDWVNNLFSNNE